MSTTDQPIFYYDFASPNAYLAHKLIPAIEQRTGARFAYVPVLLGGLFKLTGNQAPMLAFAGVPAKLAYEQLEMQRFIARHNLSAFQMNPHFPVNTLALMRGAVAAQVLGVAPAYIEAMFQFMWEQGRKLDDMAVLAACLAEAGLPAAALLEAAQTQPVKDQLAANTQEAAQSGAFGIPSFRVGTELFFGKDTLERVEALL